MTLNLRHISISIALLLFICGFSLITCEDDPLSPSPEAVLSDSVLVFEAGITELLFTVTNKGDGDLTWTLEKDSSWLTLSKTSGAGYDTVHVTIDRSGLAPGAHDAVVSMKSNGGSPSLTVTVNVVGLSVTQGILDFGTNLDSKTFQIANIGEGTLTWMISEDIDWLEVNPISSPPEPEDADITANVDRTIVTPGIYTDTIYITSNGGDVAKEVAMTVEQPTMIAFNGSGLSQPLDVYLDLSKIGTLAPPYWHVEKEVDPGTHSYYFRDEDCELRTFSRSTTVAENSLRALTISSYSLDFETPTFGEISVSRGEFQDRVRVSWLNVTPAPSYYEVRRLKDGGSWSALAEVNSSSYDDLDVQDTVFYSYNVRPVWSCANGNRQYSAEWGFTRSVIMGTVSVDSVDFYHNDKVTVRLSSLKMWGYEGEVHGFSFIWLNSNGNMECLGCGGTSIRCDDCDNVNGITSSRSSIYPASEWGQTEYGFPFSCFLARRLRTFYGRFRLYTGSQASCTGPLLASSAQVWVRFGLLANGEETVEVGFASPQESMRIDDAIAQSSREDLIETGVSQLNVSDAISTQVPEGSELSKEAPKPPPLPLDDVEEE